MFSDFLAFAHYCTGGGAVYLYYICLVARHEVAEYNSELFIREKSLWQSDRRTNT